MQYYDSLVANMSLNLGPDLGCDGDPKYDTLTTEHRYIQLHIRKPKGLTYNLFETRNKK